MPKKDEGLMGTEQEGMEALGLGEGAGDGELGGDGAGDKHEKAGQENKASGDEGGAGAEDEGDGNEAGEGGDDEPETVESLREKVGRLESRRRDGDAYISKLSNELAKVKADSIKAAHSAQAGAGDEDYKIEDHYPEEAAKIRELRDNGKDIAAAVLENKIANQIVADQQRAEREIRGEILTETAKTLKLQDFGKYRSDIEELSRNVPIRELAANPGQWVTLFYQASVGRDFIDATKKGVKLNSPGPASSSSGSGLHKPGKNQPQSEAERAADEIIKIGGQRHPVFG